MTRRGVKPLRLSLGEDDPEPRVTPPRQRDGAPFMTPGIPPGNLAPGTKVTVDLEQLRGMVRSSLGKNLFSNAIFFANKLVTLSGGQPKDVRLLAQAYYLGKQHRRAVQLIQQHGFLVVPEPRQSTAKPVAPARRPSDTEPRAGVTEATSGAGPAGQARRATRPLGRDLAPAIPAGTRAVDENVEFILLAAQCLMESGQHEEAQGILENVLGEPQIELLRMRAQQVPPPFDATEWDINPIAALCLLRGKVYELLDNRPRAAVWHKAALFCDIFCYEAFDALVDNQLRPSEERQLMGELQRLGSFEGKAAWLQPVYASRLSKHDHGQRVEERFAPLVRVVAVQDPSEAYIDTNRHNLGADLDCEADRAEGLYQQHDLHGAYQVTKKIRAIDPYHLRCITVHVASLVELKRKSELFHTAHQLVDSYPSHAIAWFAVGCYYFCINKFDPARRFFHKATTMDPSLAVAWLGFGHAFAAQDESDQAMAAYRTASRLFVGSHLPVLCTAIEYLRTNNVTLAEQFCRQAKTMCSTDPLVLNELGVVHYRQDRYQAAVDCFQESIKLCRHQPERLRYAWEPAMFNLGHAYRKLGKYDEAIQYYESALSYNPKEASTFAALGLTYHLMGRIDEAIENYHNALGLKPEDTFASEMLDKALVESYAGSFSDPPQSGESGNAFFP